MSEPAACVLSGEILIHAAHGRAHVLALEGQRIRWRRTRASQLAPCSWEKPAQVPCWDLLPLQFAILHPKKKMSEATAASPTLTEPSRQSHNQTLAVPWRWQEALPPNAGLQVGRGECSRYQHEVLTTLPPGPFQPLSFLGSPQTPKPSPAQLQDRSSPRTASPSPPHTHIMFKDKAPPH